VRGKEGNLTKRKGNKIRGRQPQRRTRRRTSPKPGARRRCIQKKKRKGTRTSEERIRTVTKRRRKRRIARTQPTRRGRWSRESEKNRAKGESIGGEKALSALNIANQLSFVWARKREGGELRKGGKQGLNTFTVWLRSLCQGKDGDYEKQKIHLPCDKRGGSPGLRCRRQEPGGKDKQLQTSLLRMVNRRARRRRHFGPKKKTKERVRGRAERKG